MCGHAWVGCSASHRQQFVRGQTSIRGGPDHGVPEQPLRVGGPQGSQTHLCAGLYDNNPVQLDQLGWWSHGALLRPMIGITPRRIPIGLHYIHCLQPGKRFCNVFIVRFNTICLGDSMCTYVCNIATLKLYKLINKTDILNEIFAEYMGEYMILTRWKHHIKLKETIWMRLKRPSPPFRRLRGSERARIWSHKIAVENTSVFQQQLFNWSKTLSHWYWSSLE